MKEYKLIIPLLVIAVIFLLGCAQQPPAVTNCNQACALKGYCNGTSTSKNTCALGQFVKETLQNGQELKCCCDMNCDGIVSPGPNQPPVNPNNPGIQVGEYSESTIGEWCSTNSSYFGDLTKLNNTMEFLGIEERKGVKVCHIRGPNTIGVIDTYIYSMMGSLQALVPDHWWEEKTWTDGYGTHCEANEIYLTAASELKAVSHVDCIQEFEQRPSQKDFFFCANNAINPPSCDKCASNYKIAKKPADCGILALTYLENIKVGENACVPSNLNDPCGLCSEWNTEEEGAACAGK